jgi:hypothetical protein
LVTARAASSVAGSGTTAAQLRLVLADEDDLPLDELGVGRRRAPPGGVSAPC